MGIGVGNGGTDTGAGRLVHELSTLIARRGVTVPDVWLRMDLTSGDIHPPMLPVGDEGKLSKISILLSSRTRNDSASWEETIAENTVSVLENTLCDSVKGTSLPCVPA